MGFYLFCLHMTGHCIEAFDKTITEPSHAEHFCRSSTASKGIAANCECIRQGIKMLLVEISYMHSALKFLAASPRLREPGTPHVSYPRPNIPRLHRCRRCTELNILNFEHNSLEMRGVHRFIHYNRHARFHVRHLP